MKTSFSMACRSLLSHPRYGRVFVIGATGSGKTHLLRTVAKELQKTHRCLAYDSMPPGELVGFRAESVGAALKGLQRPVGITRIVDSDLFLDVLSLIETLYYQHKKPVNIIMFVIEAADIFPASCSGVAFRWLKKGRHWGVAGFMDSQRPTECSPAVSNARIKAVGYLESIPDMKYSRGWGVNEVVPERNFHILGIPHVKIIDSDTNILKWS